MSHYTYPRPAAVSDEVFYALHQARYLTSVLEPQEHPKVQAIIEAYDAGDVAAMVEAMLAASALKDPERGVVASPEWVRFYKSWLVKVEQRILMAEVAAPAGHRTERDAQSNVETQS